MRRILRAGLKLGQLLYSPVGNIKRVYLRGKVKYYLYSGNYSRISHLLLSVHRSYIHEILHLGGAQISENCYLEEHLVIHNAMKGFSNLYIGKDSYIGKDCFIDLSDVVTIGENVTIAMRVTILTHFDAGESSAKMLYPRETKPIIFKKGAYVGAGSIILPGVTVGEDALIAAGTVVTKDIPPKTLVAGVPAKVIRYLDLPFSREEVNP